MTRKKTKPPAFQFYANDWLSSTNIAVMTPAMEGAYIRLLCHAWNDPDCSLPDDDAQLSILSRLGDDWIGAASEIIRKCFQKHPKFARRLVNLRLLLERKKQQKRARDSRRGGIKSGESRRSGTKCTSQIAQKRSRKCTKRVPSSATFGARLEHETQRSGAGECQTCGITPAESTRSDAKSTSHLLQSEREVAPQVTPQVKRTLQSSSSSSISKGVNPLKPPPSLPAEIDCDRFQEAWARWQCFRHEKRQRLTPSTQAAQLKLCAGWGVDRAIAAIDHTIAMGWTGLREPDPERNGLPASKPRLTVAQLAGLEPIE